MYDKRTGTVINLDNKSFVMDPTASLISIPLTITSLQTIEKDKQSRKTTTDAVNLNDFNTIFCSWKHRLEQFKLFMQIKHNSFGFSWSNSVVLQQNTENLNKLDFIKFGNPLRPKPKDRKLKNAQKKNRIKKPEQTSKARNRNKIQKTKMQPILINLQPESISSSESHEMIIEIESPKVAHQEYSDRHVQHLNLKFDEKDCLDNLLTNEDLLKLEESKSISSMIADSLVNSNLINISSINNNYFNILPVSPTICHSFFNHNEINVTQMLGSNNETGVDELFCDELKLDGEMTIHL